LGFGFQQRRRVATAEAAAAKAAGNKWIGK
jgi:hypothetical protein